MSSYQPLSPERHAAKRWRKPETFEFARTETVTAIFASEFSHAVTSLPMGFMKGNDSFVPIAIMGLVKGQNLLIDGKGKWLGRYIPQVYRSHPFKYLATGENEAVLCVDEDSDFVVDANSAGEGSLEFFQNDNSLAPEVARVRDEIAQLMNAKKTTDRVVASLARHKILRPWQINLRSKSEDEGAEQEVKAYEGLYCINEEALNQLEPQALAELRDTGGLLVAYCQLVSMRHIRGLVRLVNARARQSEQLVGDLQLGNDGGSLDFGNL